MLAFTTKLSALVLLAASARASFIRRDGCFSFGGATLGWGTLKNNPGYPNNYLVYGSAKDAAGNPLLVASNSNVLTVRFQAWSCGATGTNSLPINQYGYLMVSEDPNYPNSCLTVSELETSGATLSIQECDVSATAPSQRQSFQFEEKNFVNYGLFFLGAQVGPTDPSANTDYSASLKNNTVVLDYKKGEVPETDGSDALIILSLDD